uniref:Uncharacterized protein n=1 Tax=Musa acuminata subsp. malaccensis TaxID=214687 RepID=A0A804KTA0_MUSAM
MKHLVVKLHLSERLRILFCTHKSVS